MPDEYIKRQGLLDAYDAAHKGPPGGARKLIAEAPAEDVMPVVKELRTAVKLLHKEYERAKKSPFVRNPLAYALYQTWKAVENGR